jgi:putative nucleotidyltransferase with HDIG domain
MEKSIKSASKLRSISRNFKITTVILLFLLTAIRLALYFYFPGSEIISDKVFLSVVFCIVTYLWIQEVRDYYYLLALNKNLEEMHEQLERSEIETIASLIKTEEAKDLSTSGHSERVTKISLAIAEGMHLSDEVMKSIARAGILHDIGKINISDAILFKQEKLTDAEWEIIRSHPEEAARILEPLKFLSKERDIILDHHERYDGTGYPRGLKGDEIPIESAILAVADTFDAMNFVRPYRDALGEKEIIVELAASRGKQHSPKVIDVFLELLKKRPELWKTYE